MIWKKAGIVFWLIDWLCNSLWFSLNKSTVRVLTFGTSDVLLIDIKRLVTTELFTTELLFIAFLLKYYSLHFLKYCLKFNWLLSISWYIVDVHVVYYEKFLSWVLDIKIVGLLSKVVIMSTKRAWTGMWPDSYPGWGCTNDPWPSSVKTL